MELVKNNVYLRNKAGQAANKMYVNEEVNVSEVFPEIYNIVREKTEIQLDKVTPETDQVILNGYINYNILYYTNDSDMVYGIEGEIPFEETLRIGNTDENSIVDVKMEVDSSNVKLYNSRKFALRAEILISAVSEGLESIEFPDKMENSRGMEVLNDTVETMSVVAEQTENIRIKESVYIPGVKPAADRIVWKELKLKNVTSRINDGMINVSGEMYVFIMYLPEEADMPNQWIETTVDFKDNLEMSEATEDLISFINVTLQDGKIHLNENEEGENRELSIDAVLQLEIKLYKENKTEILMDIYSPTKNVQTKLKDVCYKKLLVKNASRTKTVKKIELDQSKGNALQICSSTADLKIDNIEIVDNGIVAKGKMKACIMYISSDDKRPVCAKEDSWEFEHRIDADGISKDDSYYVKWRVEQVNTNMVNSSEIEVKAVVALEAIVFKKCDMQVINEVEVKEYDSEMLNEVPDLVGYIVQRNDTLWNIAKSNFTTMTQIINVNKLENSRIKEGERLLLTKTCNE